MSLGTSLPKQPEAAVIMLTTLAGQAIAQSGDAELRGEASVAKVKKLLAGNEQERNWAIALVAHLPKQDAALSLDSILAAIADGRLTYNPQIYRALGNCGPRAVHMVVVMMKQEVKRQNGDEMDRAFMALRQIGSDSPEVISTLRSLPPRYSKLVHLHQDRAVGAGDVEDQGVVQVAKVLDRRRLAHRVAVETLVLAPMDDWPIS